MTQRYLVGVDGSDVGRHALRWAIEEAALRHALVHAVHAWSIPPQVSSIASSRALVDPGDYELWAKDTLESDVALISQAAGAPEALITSELVQGRPSEVLLSRADYADLLVVGNRGRGGFRGLLLGSVSQHCAAHAATPVAVVRQGSPLPDRSDIVVGIDGSRGSQAALDFAVRAAVARNARLVIAQAWWVAHPGSTTDMLPFVSVERGAYIAESRNLMREMLDVATRSEQRPDDVELVPIEDAPAPGLLALAERAGLLVIGSRGRSGLSGMLLGSVSQQCLHHARCAVIVVPPAHAR